MRTLKFYLPALLVMLFASFAPAFAQQGARRNTTVTSRQETKAERKQEKVDEGQKPTSVSSQPVTDQRMRTTGGSQSDRRNGSNSSGAASGGYSGSSGSGYSGSGYSGSGYSGGSSDRPSGGNGYSGSTGNRPPTGSGGYSGSTGNGGYSGSTGNRPPAGGGGYSGSTGSRPPSGNGGYTGNTGNRPPAGGGYPGGDYPGYGGQGGYGSGYPGGYSYPGTRPPLPTTRIYSSAESVYRTNCSSIVLRTPFRTKEEAYRYVEMLLLDSDYTIGTYGNGYSWLQSDVTFIPTPYDWTNPMTHNQFRVKASFTRYFGYVRVTLSGEWRESILSSLFSTLRFQPSSSYSTYYAWNVLEDLADAIPHTALSYR